MGALILVNFYCSYTKFFCNTSAFLYIPVKLFADTGEQ